MSTTALIIRPSTAPKIWVLEVDGPRHKYVQRGEGSYYLETSNWPSCDELELRASDGRRGRLRDWDQPYWEIYQQNDGNIDVHACRPTTQEVMRGDLHGRWGSVIHLGKNPTRKQLRYALGLARILGRCIPTVGIVINPAMMLFFESIDTELPVLVASSGTQFPRSAAA